MQVHVEMLTEPFPGKRIVLRQGGVEVAAQTEDSQPSKVTFFSLNDGDFDQNTAGHPLLFQAREYLKTLGYADFWIFIRFTEESYYRFPFVPALYKIPTDEGTIFARPYSEGFLKTHVSYLQKMPKELLASQGFAIERLRDLGALERDLRADFLGDARTTPPFSLVGELFGDPLFVLLVDPSLARTIRMPIFNFSAYPNLVSQVLQTTLPFIAQRFELAQLRVEVHSTDSALMQILQEFTQMPIEISTT